MQKGREWKGECKQQQQKKPTQTPEGHSEEEDTSISCVTVEAESNNTEWMATSYEGQKIIK